MKSYSIKYFLVVLFSMLFLACSQKQKATLNIATAANMQFAMKELVQKFEAETGINCEMIVSSSGKLTAQIKAGAPYHVFVSANMKYPNELYAAGFATQKPEIYAYGSLVLWTLHKDLEPSAAVLKDSEIQHIAVANPKTAPYGTAAIAYLKNIGIYDEIAPKLIYGESISGVNQFIVSQSAEIGFTAQSVVLSPEMKGEGQWIMIDSNQYPPIEQGVVLIPQENEEKSAAAAKFYNFLFSSEAQQVLKAYGYRSVK